LGGTPPSWRGRGTTLQQSLNHSGRFLFETKSRHSGGMLQRSCRLCRCSFHASRFHPEQTVCAAPECQPRCGALPNRPTRCTLWPAVTDFRSFGEFVRLWYAGYATSLGYAVRVSGQCPSGRRYGQSQARGPKNCPDFHSKLLKLNMIMCFIGHRQEPIASLYQPLGFACPSVDNPTKVEWHLPFVFGEVLRKMQCYRK